MREKKKQNLPGRSEVSRAGKRDTLRIPPWHPSSSLINEVNHEQISKCTEVHAAPSGRPTSESAREGRRGGEPPRGLPGSGVPALPATNGKVDAHDYTSRLIDQVGSVA